MSNGVAKYCYLAAAAAAAAAKKRSAEESNYCVAKLGGGGEIAEARARKLRRRSRGVAKTGRRIKQSAKVANGVEAAKCVSKK